MKILCLTSCTGEKAQPGPGLTRQDFSFGPTWLSGREKVLGTVPAGEMYTGQQHVRLMRGVQYAREQGADVEVHIVSAGYGLVAEDRPIAPYDITFADMGAADRRAWADSRGLPDAVTQLLDRSWDFGLILLGTDYLDACRLTHASGPFLAFAAKSVSIDGVRVIGLGNEEARRFSCGLVGLKGELAGRALTFLMAVSGRRQVGGVRRPRGLGRPQPNPQVLLKNSDPLALLEKVGNASLPRWAKRRPFQP